MSKHTPGPWRTYDIYGNGWNEVFGPKSPGNDRITVDSKEDARLIAAAPDLLEALERVTELLVPTRPEHMEILNAVNLAIKQATGEA